MKTRKAHSARISPGFPMEVPFRSIDEVNQYLDEEKLLCLLCGRCFINLERHTAQAHDVSADEYKERYGMPWGAALLAPSLREKKRAFQKAKLEADPAARSRLAAAAAAALARRKPPRPIAPTVKVLFAEQIRSAAHKHAPDGYPDCSECGRRLDEPAMSPNAKCGECRAKSITNPNNPGYRQYVREESLRRYYENVGRARGSGRPQYPDCSECGRPLDKASASHLAKCGECKAKNKSNPANPDYRRYTREASLRRYYKDLEHNRELAREASLRRYYKDLDHSRELGRVRAALARAKRKEA